MKRFLVRAVLLCMVLACTQEPSVMIEWPYVGSGQAHTKYSVAKEITAANVGELEIVWQWKPNEMPLKEYGTQPGRFQTTPIMVGNSGPMVNKGGLVFLGGGAPYLYAFDKTTGAEVWRSATPYKTNANPMTYRTRSGRQFILIATGSGPGAALVAFALD